MCPYGLICALAALFTWSTSEQNHTLVKVKDIIPDIMLDIKYAAEENFTGQKIYESNECYLLEHVAHALNKVQEELRDYNLALKIWDGYRPLSAQHKMWDIVKGTPHQMYIADPSMGGRHTRGTAVDLTMIDLQTGQEIEMPTGFDNFTQKAWRSCEEISKTAKENRQLLETVMHTHGFIGLPHEWWHFDYYDWQEHEPLDT